MKKGDYQKAIPPFKKALSINPDSAIVLNDLAWAYSQLNINLEEALSMAEKANSLEPNRPEVLDTLNTLKRKLGRN